MDGCIGFPNKVVALINWNQDIFIIYQNGKGRKGDTDTHLGVRQSYFRFESVVKAKGKQNGNKNTEKETRIQPLAKHEDRPQNSLFRATPP